MNFTYDGQECANVLHYRDTDGVTAPNLPQIGAGVKQLWDTWIKPLCANTLALRSVVCTDLSASGPPVLEYATGLPLAGTGASPQLPNNCTVAISLKTGLRGRSYRGRLYHLGLMESQVTANAVIAGTVTSLLSSYVRFALIDQVAPLHDFELGVLSYYTNGALRANPVFTAVTDLSCEGIMDSQRRRLPGRGR